jgi:uncharacterized protein YozE (UPF0346 family)
MEKIESSVKSAKEIVMEYTQATEGQDFQSVRGYLKDNVSYVPPLNSFDSAEPYLKYNLHLYKTGQLVKFDIKSSQIATMSAFSTSGILNLCVRGIISMTGRLVRLT